MQLFRFSNITPKNDGKFIMVVSFFLIFTSYISSQKNIVVPLKKEIASDGQDAITYMMSERRFFEPTKKPKILPFISKYKLFWFDINPEQGVVDRFYDKKMNTTDSFLFKSINLKNYSNIKIKNKMIFLSGRTSDNKSKVIIPDRNFNLDFTDDTILIFDLNKKSKNQGEFDNFDGVDLNIRYEGYHQNKIFEKNTNVKIYHHDPKVGRIYGNPNDKDFVMFIRANNVLVGNATIGNTCIHFMAQPEVAIDDYSKNFSLEYYNCDEKDYKKSGHYLTKDSTLKINDAYYETNISKFGDSLFLTEVYEIQRRDLPDQTVINKAFSIPKKKINGINQIQISDFKNQFVLLNFWGPWCTPCLKEMPDVKDLNNKLDSNKVKLIGIACDMNFNTVQSYLKTKQYSWVQTFECISPQNENNWSYMFKVSEYPNWILFNLDKQIIFKGNLSIKKITEILKSNNLLK
jgi:thiol-disulfide isomerase/thioredoxin